MEPISMIVGALVVGASAALKETSSQAVKDAYQGLKTMVVHCWKAKSDTDPGSNNDSESRENEANVLLKSLEENPEVFQSPLEKTLEKIIPEPDPELLKQAQALYKLVDESGFKAGKYQVTISNSQGVQVGDHNRQVNKF